MKKLFFLVVCCIYLCGCENNEVKKEQQEYLEKLNEEKRMCCLNYGGNMTTGECKGVIDYSKYEKCINNIQSKSTN